VGMQDKTKHKGCKPFPFGVRKCKSSPTDQLQITIREVTQ